MLYVSSLYLQARVATEDEVLLKHTQEYHDLVKTTKSMSQEELMNLSSKFDGMFFHPVGIFFFLFMNISNSVYYNPNGQILAVHKLLGKVWLLLLNVNISDCYFKCEY